MDDCLQAATGAACDLRLTPSLREDAISDVGIGLYQKLIGRRGYKNPGKNYLFIAARRRMYSWLRDHDRQSRLDERDVRTPIYGNLPRPAAIIRDDRDRCRVHSYLVEIERRSTAWGI